MNFIFFINSISSCDDSLYDTVRILSLLPALSLSYCVMKWAWMWQMDATQVSVELGYASLLFVLIPKDRISDAKICYMLYMFIYYMLHNSHKNTFFKSLFS